MATGVTCDGCGRGVPPHGHYVVRIDVFADPSLPDLSGEELAALTDAAAADAMAALIEQMQGMSEQELQDQVHRRFEFRLCAACHQAYLANPLGKPRRREPGRN